MRSVKKNPATKVHANFVVQQRECESEKERWGEGEGKVGKEKVRGLRDATLWRRESLRFAEITRQSRSRRLRYVRPRGANCFRSRDSR